MIYLKKPNGTIEQFEDDMGRALHIDKETQGEFFGEIYTVESLPEEDKVTVGILTAEKYLSDYKANAMLLISGRSTSERLKILDDQTINNILIGATEGYPVYLQGEAGKINIAGMIEQFKTISKTAKAAVIGAKSKTDVDIIIDNLKFPTLEQVIAQIQGA